MLVYTILQTLLSATRVPEEVRDTQNVPYNLCVLTAGCPPWNIKTLECKPADLESPASPIQPVDFDQLATALKLKVDLDNNTEIDYFSIPRQHPPSNNEDAEHIPIKIKPLRSPKGSVTRVFSNASTTSETNEPKPIRSTHHEILIRGYGNGLTPSDMTGAEDRKISIESNSSNDHEQSSWYYDDSRTSSPSSSDESFQSAPITPSDIITSQQQQPEILRLSPSKTSTRSLLDKSLGPPSPLILTLPLNLVHKPSLSSFYSGHNVNMDVYPDMAELKPRGLALPDRNPRRGIGAGREVQISDLDTELENWVREGI